MRWQFCVEPATPGSSLNRGSKVVRLPWWVGLRFRQRQSMAGSMRLDIGIQLACRGEIGFTRVRLTATEPCQAANCVTGPWEAISSKPYSDSSAFAA